MLMLAVIKAGGCAVPIAGELTTGERATLVRTTALHGVLSKGEIALPGATAELLPVGDGVQLQRFVAADPVFPVREFESLGPAFVRFSSGTTGTSKGVVLSHATLRERLDSAAAGVEWIAEVRGKGLMQAIETVQPGGLSPSPERSAALHEACKERGLLIGKGGLYGNVLRIAPPLTVTESEIDHAADIIEEVIAELN